MRTNILSAAYRGRIADSRPQETRLRFDGGAISIAAMTPALPRQSQRAETQAPSTQPAAARGLQGAFDDARCRPPVLVVPTWMCQLRSGNFSIAIMQLTDTIEIRATQLLDDASRGATKIRP
jgi:hypothetical protein